MTKFMSKKFSVGGYTKAYADNYDSVFREPQIELICPVCGIRFMAKKEPPPLENAPCLRCLLDIVCP